MPIDFRNTNTVWASILVETLQRLGLKTAIICPGSRSTPLAIAFAQHNQIEAIPILDERSAAFFALGIAKATGRPVVLVCTSGTAGANFYPAVIEAKESRVPLLVLTADRPPEMRDCHSGQTIDQLKLYGNYPNWQTELAVPSWELAMLNYLRQTVAYAWERVLFPTPGAVHLNIPFSDPLAPLKQGDTSQLKGILQLDHFFAILEHNASPRAFNQSPQYLSYWQEWQNYQQGIIIAGSAQPQQAEKYCKAIASLSATLNLPVLAEGLSPVRNYAKLNLNLISTYDLILRNRELADQLRPKMVIQIGELPISKELRAWLKETQPQRWIVDPSDHNFDPLHGQTIHLRTNIESLVAHILPTMGELAGINSSYLKDWHEAEIKVRSAIDQKMTSINHILESKAAWLLSQILPAKTPLFIANSMPVRDVEFFWQPNNLGIQPYFNRGANGIDGTLSTALGMAHGNKSSVMLTGDLALLHDTNGFLCRNKFIGHLTIILINNNGGGIFEMLPISHFEPTFEEFFATPQDIDFAQLCSTYGVEHQLIKSWSQLEQLLKLLPTKGIRVLELQTNRKADAKWRQDNMSKFAAEG
ncbi:MAG: 2-succinyl-5-enolpyruvyl-6-hydroxy-3-cyclohexene-1-carboxylic-acid synthase [Coleofasciculaceae cyanobacterium]